MPPDIDAVISYSDYWQWDFKMHLKSLKITFKEPNSGAVLAEGIYHCAEGGVHDYPTSKREVPNMLKEIVTQFKNHGR